jgi:hypothetical protein
MNQQIYEFEWSVTHHTCNEGQERKRGVPEVLDITHSLWIIT